MKDDKCFIVDQKDNIIGEDSKFVCHENSSVFNDDAVLHRAFSLFLFDSSCRLLLQQRSKSKFTFPLHWTNTCCSHPLKNYNEGGLNGIRDAVIRKCKDELNLSLDQIPFEYHSPKRIIYKAFSDVNWGEHEVDHCVVAKLQTDSIDWNVNDYNRNEVNDCLWVTRNELKDLLNDVNIYITPWFRLVSTDELLFKWWDYVNDDVGEAAMIDNGEILHLGEEEEFLEALNIDGTSMGIVMERKEIHKKNFYHASAFLWISDKKGNLLVQKRSLEKNENPGLHCCSVAGHVEFGSTPLETAVIETEEELGMNISDRINDINYVGMFVHSAPSDREICHVYHLELDEINVSEIKLDKKEVEEVILMPHSEVGKKFESRDVFFVDWGDDSKYVKEVFGEYFPEKYKI